MDGGVNVDTTTMEDATNNKNTGIDNSMIAYMPSRLHAVSYSLS